LVILSPSFQLGSLFIQKIHICLLGLDQKLVLLLPFVFYFTDLSVKMGLHAPVALNQADTGVKQLFKLSLLDPWLKHLADNFLIL